MTAFKAGLIQTNVSNDMAENVDSGFPSNLVGYIAGSVSVSPDDGTFFASSVFGQIVGLCPNGYPRFTFVTVPVQSSAAVGPDATMYIGADDRQLRAFNQRGPVLWSFSASAPGSTMPWAYFPFRLMKMPVRPRAKAFVRDQSTPAR